MVSWVPGMRWVCYVRVVHGANGLRFYGVGVGHRHPRTIALSPAAAGRLAGVVPFVDADEPAASPAAVREVGAAPAAPSRSRR